MAKNKNKTLVLNTLLFVFCCVIVALYCLNPVKESTNAAKVFKLTFDSEGGSSVAALEVPECEKVSRPPDPTRDGYVFVGWMLGDELYDFSQGICGDVELKASWKEMEVEKVYYTITYNTDGGSEISATPVEEGTIPSRPLDPYKEGYTFVGWTLNGIDYNFDEPITSDAELVAIWEEAGIVDDSIYKVTFNLNGGKGTTPEAQEVKAGEKATVPEVEEPTREKYKFMGWSTSKSATSANITRTTIKRNTVFYAAWKSTVKSYNVTIDLAGGSARSCKTKQTVEENTNPTECLSPTRANYEFVNWTDGTNTYDGISQFVITKDTTIRAVWTQTKYSITYVLNGGSGCSNSTPSSGAEYTFKVCNPSKTPIFTEINNFDGSDGKKYNANANITLKKASPNITLTANYKDVKYTVTCTEVKNSNDANTGRCAASYSPEVSGAVVKLNGKTHDMSKEIPSKLASSGKWEICSGSTCAKSVTFKYVG